MILSLGLVLTPASGESDQANGPQPPLYTVDNAISKGVVNARMSLFNATDQKHVLDSIGDIDPGIIYVAYVGVWGEIRQQDLDLAGHLAAKLRQRLPHAILGGGINESISLSNPPQSLACGGSLGTRRFVPADMIDPKQKPLGNTAWLDLANPTARDYYLCVGTMLIDRGYTLIDFEEHENVIAHSSSTTHAIKNYVDIMQSLRRYGQSKGLKIYFSGDPANDETGNELDFAYVPSRFYHTTFAQKYQNKIARPGIGAGYSYSLSAARVRDVLAATPRHTRVFFYVDNWDPKQDDLRRFMELDAANRRFLIETSARTAEANGAYFIPSLLHCVGCIPPEVVGDRNEIRPDGKTEYDAVSCGDLPVIKKALELQR
jgi:hypothetical protein